MGMGHSVYLRTQKVWTLTPSPAMDRGAIPIEDRMRVLKMVFNGDLGGRIERDRNEEKLTISIAF